MPLIPAIRIPSLSRRSRAHPLRFAGPLLVACLSAAPNRVRADPRQTKAQCVAANETGQDLRRTGKLHEARASFTACVAAACPSAVREDCAERLADVDRASPTVVFAASDATGKDLTAVRVSVDGAPLADALDGKAATLDPGEHQVRFEADGLPSEDQRVVLSEGDKNRRIHVVLGHVPAAEPPPSPPPPPPGAGLGAQRAVGIGLAGGAVIGAGVGAVLGFVARTSQANAMAGCRGGDPNDCPVQSVQGIQHGLRPSNGLHRRLRRRRRAPRRRRDRLPHRADTESSHHWTGDRRSNSRTARKLVKRATTATTALLLAPLLTLLAGAIAACASVLGFEELHTPADASVQAPPPVNAMDATTTSTPLDATSAPDTATDTSPPAEPDGSGDDAGCVPQSIALDAIGAKATVSASRTDTYAFTIAKAETVVVRVRTGAWNADVAVGTACDGSDPALPSPAEAPDGTYTRGPLTLGTYYLHVAWDATVPTSTPYTFDVMAETPATNSCPAAAALTTSTPVNGNTFTAIDTSAGCPAVPVYGQLFYTVAVPANAAWEITGTPGSAWTMVLQVLATCTSATCEGPTALSPSAGAPVTVELNNTSTASKMFLVGASASAGDGASGGGAFTLAAQALSRCPTEGASCNTSAGSAGLCCAGICEPQGTANSCGAACATACPLTYEVCTAGKCACPSTLSESCPPACVDTSSDPDNCGKCNAHCTTADPHAVGVACTKGACSPLCNSSYPTNCTGVCTNIKNDSNNCGSCGAKCTGGRTCQSKSCECTSTADPDDCGGASCTNLKTDNDNCGKCGLVCSKVDPNATGSCNGSGQCNLVCNTGYKTCTAGKPCVHVLGNDNANCGDCNVACTASNAMETAACTAGACVTTCKAQYACPGGVCTNKQTDANNCGTCGTVCPASDGGGAPSCVAGVCQ